MHDFEEMISQHDFDALALEGYDIDPGAVAAAADPSLFIAYTVAMNFRPGDEVVLTHKQATATAEMQRELGRIGRGPHVVERIIVDEDGGVFYAIEGDELRVEAYRFDDIRQMDWTYGVLKLHEERVFVVGLDSVSDDPKAKLVFEVLTDPEAPFLFQVGVDSREDLVRHLRNKNGYAAISGQFNFCEGEMGTTSLTAAPWTSGVSPEEDHVVVATIEAFIANAPAYN